MLYLDAIHCEWNDFDDWNDAALVDGWVCRNDADCTWIDERLGCNDYEFESSTIRVTDKNWPLFPYL